VRPRMIRNRMSALRGSRARRTRQILLPLLVILAVNSLLSGCTSYEAVETARYRGAQAGIEEGRRAGEAAGFRAGSNAAQVEAYRETLNKLISLGDHRRFPGNDIAVFFGFIIVGFGLQWIIFFIPRRAGYLLDIDWIVPPSEITEVDFAYSSSLDVNPRQASQPATGTMLIFFATLLSTIGCTGSEGSAWREGYDANYKAGYQEGWREGESRGRIEGQERGIAAAQIAVETGLAWQLYSPVALWALLIGAIIGVVAQHAILLRWRHSGCLCEVMAVAFVPAIKHSLSYSIFEKRRELMIGLDEEIRKIAAAKRLKCVKLKATREIVIRKLKAISSLEDFSQTRLLELARQELARIVDESEHEAMQIKQTNGVARPKPLPGWLPVKDAIQSMTKPACDEKKPIERIQ